MPIPEGWNYIPNKTKDPALIFSRVRAKHAGLDPYNFWEYPDRPHIGDFVTAPIAYLANQAADWRLREAGEVAWQALDPTFHQGLKVQVALTENPLYDALRNGIPAEPLLNEVFARIGAAAPVEEYYSRLRTITALPRGSREAEQALDDLMGFERLMNSEFPILMEPQLLYAAFSNHHAPQVMHEISNLYIHPQFLVNSGEDPVGSAAAIVYLCSRIRDNRNARSTVESWDAMNQRALMYEAHFLNECFRRKPDIHISDFARASLDAYPQGFNTPVEIPLLYTAPRRFARG